MLFCLIFSVKQIKLEHRDENIEVLEKTKRKVMNKNVTIDIAERKIKHMKLLDDTSLIYSSWRSTFDGFSRDIEQTVNENHFLFLFLSLSLSFPVHCRWSNTLIRNILTVKTKDSVHKSVKQWNQRDFCPFSLFIKEEKHTETHSFQASMFVDWSQRIEWLFQKNFNRKYCVACVLFIGETFAIKSFFLNKNLFIDKENTIGRISSSFISVENLSQFNGEAMFLKKTFHNQFLMIHSTSNY